VGAAKRRLCWGLSSKREHHAGAWVVAALMGFFSSAFFLHCVAVKIVGAGHIGSENLWRSLLVQHPHMKLRKG